MLTEYFQALYFLYTQNYFINHLYLFIFQIQDKFLMNIGLDRPMLSRGRVLTEFVTPSKNENFWVCVDKNQQLPKKKKKSKPNLMQNTWHCIKN